MIERTRNLLATTSFTNPKFVCFVDNEGPPAEPAPAIETAPNVDELGDGGVFGNKETQAIFDFDPFAGGDETTEPPPAAEPPKGAEPVAPAQPEPSPPPAPDPSVAALLQSQAELVEQLKKSNAPAEPAPAEPADGNHFADVQVPEALVNALRSDDPVEARTAVNLLVQGAANMAYRKAQADIQSLITEGLPNMMVQFTQATQVAKTVETDFYGTYPQLNKPELKPLVANIGQQIAQEEGAAFAGYTPAFRDKIATRVIQLLQGVVPQAEPQAQPKPNGQYQPTPSVRPAPSGNSDILDLFS